MSKEDLRVINLDVVLLSKNISLDMFNALGIQPFVWWTLKCLCHLAKEVIISVADYLCNDWLKEGVPATLVHENTEVLGFHFVSSAYE